MTPSSVRRPAHREDRGTVGGQSDKLLYLATGPLLLLRLPIARVVPALGVTPMPLILGLARGEKLLQEHGWLTPEQAAREALE